MSNVLLAGHSILYHDGLMALLTQESGERERQTDRQRQRDTGRQRDRETQRQTDKPTKTEEETERDRDRDRDTDRQRWLHGKSTHMTHDPQSV